MRTLIAGFGNVFFSDDGFGPAVIRALGDFAQSDEVRVRDFGIGGMHLALEMLEPYDRVILVDALVRDDEPGTLYVLEPASTDAVEAGPPDAHAMDVRAVLALYERLRSQLEPDRRPQILIAGCVPRFVGEGMNLSAAVEAAVPRSAQLVRELATQADLTGVVS